MISDASEVLGRPPMLKLLELADDSVLAAFTEWEHEQQPGVRP